MHNSCAVPFGPEITQTRTSRVLQGVLSAADSFTLLKDLVNISTQGKFWIYRREFVDNVEEAEQKYS